MTALATALALTGEGVILLASTAAATAVCLAVLGLMMFRLPQDVVLLQAHEVSGRGAVAWSVLAALAVGLLYWSTGDPARRTRSLRPIGRPRRGPRSVD